MPTEELPIEFRTCQVHEAFSFATMKNVLTVAALVVAAGALGAQTNSYATSLAAPADTAVTIHAARMIDGRGHVMNNVLLTVRRGRIDDPGHRDVHLYLHDANVPNDVSNRTDVLPKRQHARGGLA